MEDEIETTCDIQLIDGILIINDTSADNRSSINLNLPIAELKQDKYLVIELLETYGLSILKYCGDELLNDSEILKVINKIVEENQNSFARTKK